MCAQGEEFGMRSFLKVYQVVLVKSQKASETYTQKIKFTRFLMLGGTIPTAKMYIDMYITQIL